MGGWGRADGRIGLCTACCILQGCRRRLQPPAHCPLIRQQRRRGSLAARPAASAFSMADAPLVLGGRRGPQGAPASRERSQSSPGCPPRPRAAPGASPWRTRARCGGRGCPWCAGPWRPPQRTGARGRASRPASLLLAACVQPPVRAEAGGQRHLMRPGVHAALPPGQDSGLQAGLQLASRARRPITQSGPRSRPGGLLAAVCEPDLFGRWLLRSADSTGFHPAPQAVSLQAGLPTQGLGCWRHGRRRAVPLAATCVVRSPLLGRLFARSCHCMSSLQRCRST